MVVTTTNQRALLQLDPRADPIEIIGKPYDLALVVAAARRALQESLDQEQ